MAIVAKYTLDSNGNDSTGTYNLSTFSNITHAAGRFGNAAVFNGTNNDAQITSALGFNTNGNNNISISAWFNVKSIPGGNFDYIIVFVGLDPASGTRYFYRLYCGRSSGNLGFTLIGRGTVSVNRAQDTWNHVLFTTNTSQENKLYLNGVLIFTSTQNDSAGATNFTRFSIGQATFSNGISNRMDGLIDQVEINNSVLSPAEVKNKYLEGVGFFTYG